METVAPTGISGMIRKTFHSLRTRNFRLYFTGQLISNTGNWLTNVALIPLAAAFGYYAKRRYMN